MTILFTGTCSEPIAAVMIHVQDVPTALDWYGRAFPSAVRERVGQTDFEFLVLGNLRLEIVPADDKVFCGACGTVVYWNVPDFESALLHMQSIGAELYRGPMEIEEGMRMCQVRDPWGNCIGLRGV